MFKSLQPKDLASEALEQIKMTLIDGKWIPGSKFVEATVAKELGISRSPIREAARSLVQMRLLDIRPGRGFFVCQPNEQDIRNLYDLRLMLESFSIQQTFKKGEELTLANLLDETLHQIRQAQKQKNRKKYQELNLDFHRQICIASGNSHLLHSFDSTSDELRFIINIGQNVFDDLEAITERTENIFFALAERDLSRCLSATERYTQLASENVTTCYIEKLKTLNLREPSQ
ncbi:GntR family transcriptional regulator [Vibrio astriarenae]